MINIYVQSETQTTAETYGEPYANMTDAMEAIDELKEEFDVVMCDADTDGARAHMDIDGHFYCGWKMRVEGVDEFDYVAIVQEV